MTDKTESPCCAATRGGEAAAAPAANEPAVAAGTAAGQTSGMVRLDGEFLMGTDQDVGFPSDGEGPVRKVSVAPCYIDTLPVTNRQFARFARSTRYKTEAEVFGWSFVFHSFVPQRLAHKIDQAVAGTEW